MVALQSSVLTTVLGLAAMFLAISLLVQVLQELYKYLRSSKARAYQKSLIDYLGPWANLLMRPSSLPDVRVRGPMQLRRLRPAGMVLPLEKESLVDALERTAPSWVQRAYQHLSLEAELQSGKNGRPSKNWRAFLRQLGAAEQGTPGYWSAYTIAGFMGDWGHSWKPENPKRTKPKDHPVLVLGELKPPLTLDAAAMLKAYHVRFFPEVEHAAENFDQFQANFEHTYRRLNVRLTFTISLVVALLGNLPIGSLWDNASRLDPQSAVAYAEKMLQLSQESTRPTGAGGSTAAAQVEIAKKLVQQLVPDTTAVTGARWIQQLTQLSTVTRIWSLDFWSIVGHILGCVLTAIVVTFGAPFWNDIASALLRLQKGMPATQTAKEGNNG